MSRQTSRRAFLRGAFQEAPTLRPFGAIPGMEFADLCTKCGDCHAACPEAIIVDDRDGFPVLDLNMGGCTFCGECTEACETGALDSDTPWIWRANAAVSCLSMNSVQCRICQDHCDNAAIRFRLQPGGCAEPQIDMDACTGCGSCVSSCPVGAIELVTFTPETEARQC